MYSLRIAAACFHEEVEENKTILSFIRRLDEAKLTQSHFGMELEEESFKNLKNSLHENSLFDGASREANFDFNFCGKSMPSYQRRLSYDQYEAIASA
jgi:hypothetical protein